MSNYDDRSGNNRANIIPHDSTMRGYSVENSFYDSPFNMDFEYGYMNLMFNITTFTARTHDIFQSLESNLSNIIELQNERRRIESESRQMRETREINQNINMPQPVTQPATQPVTQPVTQPATQPVTQPVTQPATQPVTQPVQENRQNISPNIPDTTSNDNLNYLLGRRNIFDTSNNILFSFLPRNVLINPNSLPERRNRNRGGLNIQEIEENTEIINYNSIDAAQILNTECPISRDVFNANSVVLRLKECRHCFVPFRIMTWLETHSTCPLCRRNVVPAATPAPAPAAPAPPPAPAATPAPAAPATTFSNIINNIRNNTNLDNLSVDNVNDDSIVFSFDLPRSVNDDTEGREFTNTYFSSLSQIFSNLNRNTTNTTNTTNQTNYPSNSTDNNDAHNEHEDEYDEVD